MKSTVPLLKYLLFVRDIGPKAELYFVAIAILEWGRGDSLPYGSAIYVRSMFGN